MRSIAIVGRSCVLPGALTPESLWDLSVNARVLFEPCRRRNWRVPLDIVCKQQGLNADHLFGSYVHGFDSHFDPDAYKIPKEFSSTSLDPLLKWILYTAWESLKEAGGDQAEDKKNCSLILGNLALPTSSFSSFCEKYWLSQNGFSDEQLDQLGFSIKNYDEHLTSRFPAIIAKKSLGLGGQAFSLDAACASSSYAIKLGCDLIRSKKSKLVLVGAAQGSDDLLLHLSLSHLKLLSKRGHCKPFQADTDGILPAEGACFVCLMDLQEAEDRACHIYGVIKGVGTCHDGRGHGLLIPKTQGQTRVIHEALKEADCAQEQISYIECHAAGTLMGDATEIQSLKQSYSPRDFPLYLGSLKGNLGHLISASGLAGLIRITEAFKHGQMPPLPYVESPMIQFEGSSLEIPGKPLPWPSNKPRLAGLSDFGIGGHNAHLIVEEFAQRPRPQKSSAHPGILSVSPSKAEAIAVVGVKLKVGAFDRTESLLGALFSQESQHAHMDLKKGHFKLGKFKIPLSELEASLGQHLLFLELFMEAREGLSQLNLDTTGIVLGMGLDPNVCRYGMSIRLDEWSSILGQDEVWLGLAKEKVAQDLCEEGVLGFMQSLLLSRVCKQEDFGGSSFVVNAEVHSGGVALDIAMEQLRQGSWDTAFVAAVDVTSGPIQMAAFQELAYPHDFEGSDGGAILVLKRFTDAIADGDEVKAIFGLEAGQHSDMINYALRPEIGYSMSRKFGHVQSAASLIHVAGAVMSLHYKLKPEGDAWPLSPKNHLRTCRVQIDSMFGDTWACTLSEDPATTHLEPPTLPKIVTKEDDGKSHNIPYHWPAIHLPILDLSIPFDGSSPKPNEQHSESNLGDAEHQNVLQKKQAFSLDDSLAFHGKILQVHKSFLSEQKKTHQYFLEFRKKSLETMLAMLPKQPNEKISDHSSKSVNKQPTTIDEGGFKDLSNPHKERELVNLELNYEDLLNHSQGKLEDVFGVEYQALQSYGHLICLPSPPFLLINEASIQSVPLLGKGRVTAKAYVEADSWYVHENRMVAGVQLEMSQALSLLTSFQGIDQDNRAEKSLHLLACDLTVHAPSPKVGDTLYLELFIDEYTRQGDLNLISFGFNCFVNDALSLSVKNGTACVFSHDEKEFSSGALWSAEEYEPCTAPRLEYPLVDCSRNEFSNEQVAAFSLGKLFDCFGTGFEKAQSQYHSPRIPPGNMCLIDNVAICERDGGPWKRGYLKAQAKVSPNNWIFSSQSESKKIIPSSLIVDASLQCVAFYMAYCGLTLDRDAWRFEPAKGASCSLSWQAQLTPDARLIEYEVYIEEVIAKPMPQVSACVLGRVDGLSFFVAKNLTLELVPDFSLLPTIKPTRPQNAEPREFPFDHKTLIACALGAPSTAYPIYRDFPQHCRIPRIPAPPYHFCTQVRSFEGEWGGLQEGAQVLMEYHFDGSEWYFANRDKMPLCILLEVALQPCSWLSSALGSALMKEGELISRNLNGKARLLAQVDAKPSYIVTRARLSKLAKVSSMYIQSFEVSCFIGEATDPFFTLTTDFGFLSLHSLENQVGFITDAKEHEQMNTSGQMLVDLTKGPKDYTQGSLSLQQDKLLMLDRIMSCDLNGGSKQLGFLTAEKDVKADEWFFQAHFLSDPLMPGSLMIEGAILLLRFFCIEKGFTRSAHSPEWEVLALGSDCEWRLRGQVLPDNKLIRYVLNIDETILEPSQVSVFANASLWLDGTKIAVFPSIGIRIRADGPVREECFKPELPLSRQFDTECRLSKQIIDEINDNPFTVKELFGSYDPRDVLFKEYVAHKEGVPAAHVPKSFPFNNFPVRYTHDEEDLVLIPEVKSELVINPCLDYWSQTWGLKSWLGEDLLAGLLQRFVHSFYIDEPHSLLEAKNQAIIFVSNQQVAVENPIFSALMSTYLQKPVLNLVRQKSLVPWIADLMSFVQSYPGISMPKMTFDLSSKQVENQEEDLNNHDILGHQVVSLPGFSADTISRPKEVTKFTKALLKLVDCKSFCIVPVGFFGALPQRTMDKKLGFPYAMSKQRILVGKPLTSHELQKFSLEQRLELLSDAIFSLDGNEGHEELLEVDEEFGRSVHSWMLSSRVKVEQAVLFCTLREMLEKGMKVSLQTQRLVEARLNGVLKPLDDPEIHAWLERVTRWLLGRKYFA